MEKSTREKELSAENERLREELEEARDVLRAIRYDQVDALIVAKPNGNAVYTLKGANRTYRILIETINEGTAILSADGAILFCNSRFMEMVKANALTVMGAPMESFLAPGEGRVFDALLRQGIRENARGEIRLKASDGSTIPVYLSVNSLQVENMQGACVIATDLTEQKRNEEIVAAGQLARTILDQAAQAIIVCDDGGRIIQTSRMAQGLCEKNPIFQQFDALFKLEPVATEGEPGGEDPFSIDSVLSGNTYTGLAVSLANCGRKYHLLLNAGPLYSGRGRIIGAVVTMTDVTELREAHEEVRRARDELELRVRERTAELTRLNKELQDFAFIASHDLQEPLRKIQSFGDRLKAMDGGVRSPTGKDYLERMQKAAVRMRGLIDDLLNYSRIETKAQPFSPVDLSDIARSVLSDLEVRIEQTGGRVDVGEMPEIEAEPSQMRQLLQNLIGNALKFHEEERPVVKVHGQVTDGGGECRIFVEDNGIGFEEQYLDRIFSPFQRLHGRSAYEGTGMGLAICKRIVERHKGSITAQSRPGEGAVFIVTLPVKQTGERSR